jgi:hypothetical protein
MPIVEPPTAGSPLNQGDILRGITLLVTKESWNEKGGDVARAPFKMCMIVSRPCVVDNKKHITVTGVDKYPDETPRDVNTFDKVLDFMTGARDGQTSPDVFYLGQLPGMRGRYCARLDSLHQIEIPIDPAVREAFVAKTRVASLIPDFLRSLHTRLFGAFANLGFDDHRWPSTEDLKWIVMQGQADIAKQEGEVNQHHAQQLSREAEDKKFEPKPLTAAEQDLAILKARVKPYEQELARRLPETASTSEHPLASSPHPQQAATRVEADPKSLDVTTT